MTKIPWKAATIEKPQKMTPGGTQNDLILNVVFVILLELAKIAPQRYVFGGSIFWQIFGIAKNMSQGATGNPDRANSEGPGPPRSMTKVMLDWKSYRMKGLTRIQHASEPLARRIIISLALILETQKWSRWFGGNSPESGEIPLASRPKAGRLHLILGPWKY